MYTQWTATQPYKEENAICSNMVGTTDSHTKGSKSEKETQIMLYRFHLYCNIQLKRNPYTERKQTHGRGEKTCGC